MGANLTLTQDFNAYLTIVRVQNLKREKKRKENLLSLSLLKSPKTPFSAFFALSQKPEIPSQFSLLFL